MERKFVLTGGLALFGFVLGISFFAYTIVTSARLNTCIVCKRHIHGETRTVAEIDGHRTVVCCPSCARRWREQEDKQVRILEVTDLDTGKSIDARKAYVVVGGDVNYCARNDTHFDEHKAAAQKLYDRCSPGMISFASLDAARRYQSEHGGKLMPGDFAFGFGRQSQGN